LLDFFDAMAVLCPVKLKFHFVTAFMVQQGRADG
jgi:hypothetical protein